MTHYRTTEIDGLKIFYREAGDRKNPTLLLLHGFPASSFMFRELIDRLSDQFHVVAPDYPGFGYSDAPPRDAFSYTFDHLATVIEKFADHCGLSRYALYLQDFGGRSDFVSRAGGPTRSPSSSSRTQTLTKKAYPTASGRRRAHFGATPPR
jgi:pimeloyl-ACP methyl ester carboxylesterase